MFAKNVFGSHLESIICKTINVRVRVRVTRGGSVWWRVPVPLPLPLGAEGHVGRDTRLSGWGMVYIPL